MRKGLGPIGVSCLIIASSIPGTGWAQWQQATSEPPPAPSAWVSCAASHNHPELAGWCHDGSLYSLVHVNPYKRVDDFYGLLQVGGVVEARRRTIALAQVVWFAQSGELFTLAQVGIRDTSARVWSIVQLNLLNWQSEPLPTPRCPKGSMCNQRRPDRQGRFVGGLQLGLFNRGEFHGLLQSGAFGNISDEFAGGLQIGLLNYARRYWGLGQIGVLNATEDHYLGIQGGLANYSRKLDVGMQVGAINFVKRQARGLQAGLANYAGRADPCVQLGVFNLIRRDMQGAQIGLLNTARKVEGVQIGLVNWARRLKGIQIGLVNVVKDARFPVVPVVNVGFST